MSWRDNNIPSHRMRDHWRILSLFLPLVPTTKLKDELTAKFRQTVRCQLLPSPSGKVVTLSL
ncbi:hypothetical protein [Microbulbifer sp. VAAF005]|uniref:hypothetical protein n=1 Tax=Microbulbifer sp. VAAF005 TaxID=3034230 RepID=UPI0024ADD7B7|nr:hypothetical protein [Microbulbifer sp. VAAF005]WHI45464.1 hypothetical protein P0078_17265 [Microbulbifer sp. VAAF005]